VTIQYRNIKYAIYGQCQLFGVSQIEYQGQKFLQIDRKQEKTILNKVASISKE